MDQQSLIGGFTKSADLAQSGAAQSNMTSENKRGRSGSEPIEIADDSEPDDTQEQPPPKKRRTAQPDMDQLPDDMDEGEVADLSSNENSQPSRPAHPPRTGPVGWNEGVKPAGLRISFGSTATIVPPKPVTVPTTQEPSKPTVAGTVRDPGTAAVQEEPTEPTDQQVDPRKEKSFKFAGLKWKLPPPPGSDWTSSATSTWQFKFEQWCQDFVALNNDKECMNVLRDAKQVYFLLKMGYNRWQKKRQYFRKAASAIEDYKSKGKFPHLLSTIQGNISRGEGMSPLPLLVPTEVQGSEAFEERGVTALPVPAPFSQNGDSGQGPEPPLSKSQAKKKRRAQRDGAAIAAAVAGEQQSTVADEPPLSRSAAKKRRQAEREAAAMIAAAAATGNGTQQHAPGVEAAPNSVTPVVGPAAASPMVHTSQESSPSGKSSGEVSETTADLHGDMDIEDDDDRAYRERYYPGLSASQEFCTACARFGHRYQSCPEARCRFCGDSEHMAPGCPTRQRCSKCKQLGHAKDNCREKLALAPGEGMECAFCASKEHTESDCNEFWRSYRPSEETIRKVKDIPIFCYCCGSKGHYGTSCGLNPAPTKTTSVELWSKENWQQYIDPNSTEEAIAWDPRSSAGAYADNADGRPNFGKSIVPQRHVFFEDDDDDDDEGFIQPPVQRQQQNGQISVGRQGRGGFSSLAKQGQLPPLPPGPPPGLPARPPQANGGRPRKPKPFQSQGQGQGQQNGHGGGGFRIRGGANRGRGGRGRGKR